MRVLLIWLALALPVFAAMGPEEVMEDPALHARAMALYDELRCVQCRSESIASSNAPWAQDARAAVRDRLLEGDTDAQVKAFFQARYGDYVLMNPPVSLATIGLWLAGPLLLLLGALVAWRFVSARPAKPAPETALSAEEEARLKDLLSQADATPGLSRGPAAD